MKTCKALCILILIVTLCSFTNHKEELKITYLANCGFLYDSGRSKVLIDPFGTQYGGFFYLPSNETRTAIVKGNVPFNHIDLLLITHIHGDHFDAKLAEAFLLNNPETKMICPSQVYKQMKDSCIRFDQIKSQITSPDLIIGASETVKINGIPVAVLRMQHGTNRSLDGISYADYTGYEKTENFGYVIHFGQKTVFHQGDGCLKINAQALRKLNCAVDIAYLSYFDWDAMSLDILKEDLKAAKVIFMHGTKPAKELQTEQLKSIAPQLIFFHNELESQSF